MDVAPADLIGEPELVVSGRIELVEGLTTAVGRVVVAGREVVFGGQLDGARARAATRGSASVPPTRSRNPPPAIHAASPSRRRSRAVPAACPRRARPSSSARDCRRWSSSLRRFTSRRQKRYGSTAACGITLGDDAYTPASRLPLPLLSNSSGRLRTSEAPKTSACQAFARRMTRAASHERPVFTQARCPSRRCSPKASSCRPSRAPTGAFASPMSANAGAQIERSAERRRRRADLFLGDARILHVGLERQALRGGDRRVQPHATERIGVVAVGGEAAVLESFDALAKLTAHAQPRRHDAVRAIGKWRPRRRLQLCGGWCRGGGLCWLWSAGCLWLRACDLLLRSGLLLLLRAAREWHCDECQKNDRRTCHTLLSLRTMGY